MLVDADNDVPGVADEDLARGANRAGHVRAVTEIVHRVRVVVGRVDPVAVVDEAVAIVVNPVGVAIGSVSEHVVRKIGMRVVDAGVEDRHDDAVAAARNLPSLRKVDVCTRNSRQTDRHCGIPTARKARSGRRRVRCTHDLIQLRVLHIRVKAIQPERLREADTLANPYELETFDMFERPQGPGTGPAVRDRPLEGGRTPSEADEDLAIHALAGWTADRSGL